MYFWFLTSYSHILLRPGPKSPLDREPFFMPLAVLIGHPVKYSSLFRPQLMANG